jgi:hypothetical protein
MPNSPASAYPGVCISTRRRRRRSFTLVMLEEET